MVNYEEDCDGLQKKWAAYFDMYKMHKPGRCSSKTRLNVRFEIFYPICSRIFCEKSLSSYFPILLQFSRDFFSKKNQ